MDHKQAVYYMFCPECGGQDSLLYESFRVLVLEERDFVHPYNKKRHFTPEGQYFCPYGCGCQMLLFAVGSYGEVGKISEKLTKKYPNGIPNFTARRD